MAETALRRDPTQTRRLVRSFLLSTLLLLQPLEADTDSWEIPPGISLSIAKKIAPYTFRPSHPDYETIQNIFTQSRAIENKRAFKAAGFNLIASKRLLIGGVHPSCPHLFIKAYPDSVRKDPLNSFLTRAKTARKMQKIITDYNITHVKVPEKYIYVLPKDPKPENGKGKKILLVETYLPGIGIQATKAAWTDEATWTEAMIDDLYLLLSHQSLYDCAYRNFQFSADKKTIILFDLETPVKTLGDFNRMLANRLPKKWRKRWDKLVRKKIKPRQ